MSEPIMFPRLWCMPNRYTFAMPPVHDLLYEEMTNGALWFDPFAGHHSPAQVRNDIDPTTDVDYHMDALSFLKMAAPIVANVGVVFDPPYSAAMAGGKYANPAAWIKYIHQCMDEVARIIRPGGKAICFGWSSNGLGKKRGFELTRGLLLAHGGSHQHDTIVTVEVKQ